MIHSTDEMVSKVTKFKNNNPEKFKELCKKESELSEKSKTEIRKENAQRTGGFDEGEPKIFGGNRGVKRYPG